MCSQFYVEMLKVEFGKCFAPELQSLPGDISRNKYTSIILVDYLFDG